MIKDIAIGLIDTYNTNNPFELCDCLDIKVVLSDLGNIKGYFMRSEDGYEVMNINSSLLPEEQKYICAHELGHAIMHTDVAISFFIENPLQVKSRYEIEADTFASELLVDETQIDNYRLEEMNSTQLASFLKVPEKLIQYKFRTK